MMDTQDARKEHVMALIGRSGHLVFQPLVTKAGPSRAGIGLFLLLSLLWPFVFDVSVDAQEEQGAVYVIEITGTIDLGLAPYLERVIDEATDNNAAAVILDIDTFGGRLDAAIQMRDTLLASDVLTVAFVDRTAFSAGALVAIASHRIYMTPGATVGASTPVDGGSGETSSEKVISAVRATFKTTAEARGRNPIVAEAMVDENIAIEGLVGSNQLLTLTTSQATEWGYSDGVVSNQAELLDALGLSDAPIIQTSMGIAERAARFITDPVIASLLMIIGLLLIIGDFLVEGVGLPALVGVALLAIFFWGHLVAGLAGWEDLALVVLGLILIALELVVIPGFGVAGILGLIALFGGLFLAVLSRDIRTPDQTERAVMMVAITCLAVVAGFVAILIVIPYSRRMGGLVLRANVAEPAAPLTPRSASRWLNLFGGNSRVDATVRPKVTSERDLVRFAPGLRGVAMTELRPSGTAEFGRRLTGHGSDRAFGKEHGWIPEL
jgi:membrane-bound serine protease (ClpP class)